MDNFCLFGFLESQVFARFVFSLCERWGLGLLRETSRTVRGVRNKGTGTLSRIGWVVDCIREELKRCIPETSWGWVPKVLRHENDQ